MMDFDRPYAKTTSIDAPPHYLQDGKTYSLQGVEIVTDAVIADAPSHAEQPAVQPKKRGRKPTK